MASFNRKCKQCATGITVPPCGDCGGSGLVQRPIKIPVRVAVDNRAPRDFVMLVTPDGNISFRQAGHKRSVSLTTQQAFNRAQQLTAAAMLTAMKSKRLKKTVKRGLLTLGR